MKAINYLQRIGAIPQYSLWDLQMAVVVITDDFFNASTLVEPDCLEWVQSADSETLFLQRLNLIAFSTSGDVRALGPTLFSISDTETLKELVRELIELKLLHFALSNGDLEPYNKVKDESWFVDSYNKLIEMPLAAQFVSKAQILAFYYSGSVREVGEAVLSRIAGPQEEFHKAISLMEAEVLDFLQRSGVKVTKIEQKYGKLNPYEGVPLKVLWVNLPGDSDDTAGELMWAPWATLRPQDEQKCTNSFRELCDRFNKEQEGKWFSNLH